MNYEGFDWGFNPAGTPLGGESSLSMPGPRSIPGDFGQPRQLAYDARRAFSKHVKKVYGKVNPWNAGLWDPRGVEALTENPCDYTDGMREINATIKDFDAEADRIMNGGVREFGVARPNTNVSFDFLNRPATGLAPESAAMLKKALEVMDPGVVETIAVPNDISQLSNVNNELGFVTPHGGIPSTFLDQNVRVRSGPTLAEAAMTALATNQKPIEQVDENGIVFTKYSPGTGPYDAPGGQRPGGIAGAIRGTAIGNDKSVVRSPGTATTPPPMSATPQAAIVPVQPAASAAAPNGNGGAPVWEAPPASGWVEESGYADHSATQSSFQYGQDASGQYYTTQGTAPTGGAAGPAKGASTGHIIGFVGLGLAAALGLGMLIKGATA